MTTTMTTTSRMIASAIVNGTTFDMDGYPPTPITWLTAGLDTICYWTSCQDWRSWIGATATTAAIANRWLYWLSFRVPSLSASYPRLPSFQEYCQEEIAQPCWSGSDDPARLFRSLYRYAFATPSTALADLTSPTSCLALLLLLLVFRSIKALCMPMFWSLGRKAAMRTHGPNWEDENGVRILKFGEYVYRLLYHAAISAYGLYYFWDSEWWKGEPGSTLSLFEGYPYHPIPPAMTWYYLLQSAYNLDALVSLLEISFRVTLQKPSLSSWSSWKLLPVRLKWSDSVRGDFREMLIHHVVTNLLVIGSSFCRLTRCGSMVFMVHDISDVPVDLSKLANFLKWKLSTICCFVTMVLVWFVTRLYILPFVIFKSSVTESHYILKEGFPSLCYICYRHFFYGLLGFLIFLHALWFAMFLRMAWTLAVKYECHDYTEHKQGEIQQQQQQRRDKQKQQQQKQRQQPNVADNARNGIVTKPTEPSVRVNGSDKSTDSSTVADEKKDD